MAEVTTTGYMILGLLSTRDWSAYDIASQSGKGMTELWPRADRQLYNAPKRLVEHGLAAARTEKNGRRTRTIYSITPAGRTALRKWLTTPSGPPSLEFEGMIRVMFADQGSIENLRDTLHLIGSQAATSRDLFAGHAAYMAENSGGTHFERQHLFALANMFMIDHFTQIIEWADWAVDQTESWTDASSPGQTQTAQTKAILDQVAAKMKRVTGTSRPKGTAATRK